MNLHAHSHVYDRVAVSGADDAPGRIMARIRPGAKVLDVGTGSGALGRCLSVEKNCIVDGLTCNPAEMAFAQTHYRRVALTDLEREPASHTFAGEVYDYIVCADVLEHLRNADDVLADLGHLLSPDGRVLVSVPNVTYLGVIASLVAGHLCRTREGLIDATHVRFFDRRGIDELANAAGMTVTSVERVVKNLAETEFRYFDLSAFPQGVSAYLRTLPDSMTYEYVIELVVTASPAATNEMDYPAYAEIDTLPQFAAQAFFDYGQGFCEQDSAHAFGQIGNEPVRLSFSAHPSAPLRGLLIDFADRPGTFELFGVKMEDEAGAQLWQWLGDWSSHFLFRDLEILPVRGALGGRLMRGTGDKPRMQIEFDPPLPLGIGAVLAIDMTAPQRYEAVAFELANRNAAEEKHSLRGFLQTSADENQDLHRLLRSAADENCELHRLMQSVADEKHALNGYLQVSRDENQELHRLLQSAAEEKHALNGYLQASRNENQELHRLLQFAAEEKNAFVQFHKMAAELIEKLRGDEQRREEESNLLRERVLQLESVIASPFRRAAARLRWLLRRIGRDGS